MYVFVSLKAFNRNAHALITRALIIFLVCYFAFGWVKKKKTKMFFTFIRIFSFPFVCIYTFDHSLIRFLNLECRNVNESESNCLALTMFFLSRTYLWLLYFVSEILCAFPSSSFIHSFHFVCRSVNRIEQVFGA